MRNFMNFGAFKKIVSCLLVFVLVATNITTAAFAATPGEGRGDDSYNAELLRLLSDEYGAEQAPAMLETIQKLGLANANGQLLNYSIIINNKSYTVEELKQLFADENTDLTQMAEVDGEPITLAALKEMIAIEERLSSLLSAGAEGGTGLSSEHLDNLDSLLSQVDGEGGLRFVDENGNPMMGARGLSAAAGTDYEDETVVSVTKLVEATGVSFTETVSFTFELNKAQSKPVSFSYELMDSTLHIQPRNNQVIKGTVEFQPGETTKTITFNGLYVQRNIIQSYCVSGRNDFSTNPGALSTYQNYVWTSYGRADYLHFSNFNNFDRMDFDQLETTRDYVPFTHAYEGGGYLSFTLGTGQGLYKSDSLNGVGFGACYSRGDTLYGDRVAWKQEPVMKEVKAQAGSYTTGQIIPMQVLYSNIISREQPRDPASRPRLSLVGGGVAYPDVMPFADFTRPEVYNLAYPSLSLIGGYMAVVGKGMTSADMNVVDAVDETAAMWGTTTSPYEYRKIAPISWGKDFTNTPNIVINPARGDAFQSLTLEQPSYTVGQTLKATLQLSNDNGEADWLIDGVTTSEEIAKRVMISIGDKNQGRLDLHWKLGGDGLPLSPPVLEGELQITKSVYDTLKDADANVDGKQLRAKVYYNRNMTPGALDAGNKDDFGMMANQTVNFQVGEPKFITPADLSITYPASWPSGTPYVVNLIDATATKLGFTYPLDATHVTPDQFEWRSSDASVAGITADGTILPKGAGTVIFTLAAKNNGEAAEATVTSQTITISADGSAAVVVPSFANRVYVNKSKDANIIWSTNVMDRYKELAGAGGVVQDANFKLEFFEGFFDEAQLAGKQPTQTWEAPAIAELINATSFRIPGSYIKDISNSNVPSYTVRISTVNPENALSTLSAVSYIVVRSEAAIVTLDKSMGQFVLDSVGTLPVAWTLDNFDPVNKGEFEFQVTRNGVLIPESRIVFDKATGQFSDAQVTATGGSYNLNLAPVTGSKQIKDVYTITLAVKNSTDSTWSYDSLFLQVYKSDALQIQIDGQPTASYKMSNIDRIKQMTSDQILALKRNIMLNNELGVNNKDYDDLGEITDQIAWKSSNNKTGAIYHRSNGYVEDIEKFNNSSYQPKQKFLLGGLSDGQTTITATHARTGIKAELDLTVETLKDKLYLFQLYPKTETTLTYTNGTGAEKSVKSDANGELALYEESGIASDVYVTSVFNGTTYTGVLSQDRLLSQEGNPAQLELYPINILQLRQLSKVEVFFKTPDGKPYTGKVTYRGGVYKNGYYAEATEIGGAGITETLAGDGKLEIIFDTTDFYSVAAGEKNAADLSAKDKLEFIIETRFDDDRYNPSLISLDGDASPVDRIVIGDKIARMISNDRQQPTPVIVNQVVANSDQSSKTDIRDYRGKFGPNNTYPSIQLTTELLWWGEEADKEAYAQLESSTGLVPQGQSYQTLKYPFSDLWLTRHVQVLNKDTIWLDKARSGSVHFKLYDKPGSFRKSFTSTATLVNMIGVSEVSVSELRSGIQKLKNDMNSTNGSTNGPSNNDKVVLETLSLLGNLKMDVGPLSMRVYPTDDPTVFKMIMSASLNKMASTQGSSDVQFFQSKNNFAPGAGDLYKIAMGQFVEDQKRQYSQVNKDQHSGKNIPFSAGGYYIGEIKYNLKTDAWEAVVHGGGFNAGGGFEYSWAWNIQAGIVPVTFSLTIGGGVEVGFRASVLFDEVPGNPWSNPQLDSVNDYLTSLRVIAYIEAFGGIGFDYSIIAAKIGVFGRITLENTSTWLNRDYLKNSNDRVLYGNKLTMESIVGVRVVIKFLFISIKHDFASLRYSHTWLSKNWNKIQDYWKENATMPLMASNAEVAIMAYMRSIGEDPMQVLSSQTMEDRSYLNEYDRAWQQAPTGAKRSLLAAAPSGPQVLQSNAYPYSNPQVAADGSLFVYLSDNNSANVEDTVASWAVRNGQGGYDQRGEIVTDAALKGYGDTGLQLAGEGNLIAAVWVRQKDKINKEAGEELTGADMLLMNNSAEVMVSIYDGTKWTTHRLTNNQSPDVAPIVSVGNGKVVVAYRSVYSSNVENPLDFSESDSIVYKVYDTASGVWSDTETLYNGTNGTVMGMSAETLTDGTAAVVYTVNKGNTNQIPAEQYVAGTDNEIVYAVIDTSPDPTAQTSGWKTKGVVKNLQVTHDRNANENPQLTSAIFPDGIERFVMAWYATSGEDDSAAEDIRMLAVNRDGEVYSEFVDSLSAVKAYNNVRINPNFVFAKMPQADRKLEHLSLIWKEAQVETTSGNVISRDVLKAVKLGMNGGELYLSGVMELGAMPEDTAIDTIAAYIGNSSGTEINALLLGTTYTTDTEVVGAITPKEEGEAGGNAIPVTVSKAVSAMYTASATYHNQFNAEHVVYNPGEIVAGYELPIQFNVVNQGLSAIQSVDITINGELTNYNNLSLVPNSAKGLIAYHTVPSPIADAPYQIEVAFADGERQSTAGILRLDVPDTGISKIKVMKEEGGKRILSIPVYNKNGTTSVNKGRVVKLALYEDNQFTDDSRIGNVIEISDADDLSLVDQGAYVETVEFDVRAYLTKHGLQEIPDNGITVYLRSWAEDAQGEPLKEFDESDNEAKVTLDNLALKYNENQVLLTMEQTNTASRTNVDLTMQNMNMASISSGNVLLNLLDAEGQILETKYVATDAAGLLSFSAEEKKTATIQFGKAGHSVQGMFFQESADALDATLSTVALSGIELDFDPGQTAYALQSSDLKRTHIVAVASNSGATVSLLDGEGNVIRSNKGFVSVDKPLELSTGGALNEFTISVQPASAAGTAMAYPIALTNTQSSKPHLEVQVKGTKGADGKYADDVELSLSPYDVEGFEIDKAQYQINNGNWTTAAYNGKTGQKLTTLSGEGSYRIAAKIILASGLAYELDPVTLEIGGPVIEPVDAAASSATASKTKVIADGKDQATIKVIFKNAGGNALSGRQVILTADGGSSKITAVEDTTNAKGEASFTVTNTVVESVRYTAKDAVGGVTLSPVQVSFESRTDSGTGTGTNPNPGTDPSPGTDPKPDPGTDPEPKPKPDDSSSLLFKKGLIAFEELLRSIKEKLQSTANLDTAAMFTDIQKHWALKSIDKLVRLEVIKGYGDSRLKPNNPITRAEFASMLARLFVFAPTDAKPAKFADVQGYWAEGAIDTLTKHGILKGYQDGTFKPNAAITREEMIVILMRLINEATLPQSGSTDFQDLSLAGKYARDSLMAAAKAGVIQGYGNSLNPKGNASRAETATMLLNLLKLEPRLQEVLEP
ncbi:S-layer homology domain-containing protein [Paenibacillus spongiae]|uniref:S-layer homology domain-containing protein n=1 Tax=Paenibacillus spongiae TaxID=2909671 RepID=A0ABY5SAF9_9BACL|nr:S-layer homology domain-containing protein [Paenibacillus spongiae]UVI30937.1 S-layer homology domain-containing protein [Paenibacillus spongiae]